jgi:succinate dehydrogenase / fumarate reductase flavoprotein subunit
MQGLGDGYFVIPYTIGGYLADRAPGANGAAVNAAAADAKRSVEARIERLLAVRGKRAPQDFHRELGLLLWNLCGLSRTAQSLTEALATIPRLRAAFWQDVSVKGTASGLNQTLERAGRVADFLEFAELLVRDALAREESCGAHFRAESQTEEGEARRDDSRFCHVAAWEYRGADETPVRHQEPLTFESMALSQRSYK